ncbi:MAG: cation diffusion facilitator family transporter [Elusimicrobiota bacterium]
MNGPNNNYSGQNTSEILKITWIGVVTNILLVIVKFVLGVFGRSHALIADAVHSLSDLGSDFAIIFGINFWSKPPDDDHQYGHSKIEILVAGFIGTVLLLVGLGIGLRAVLNIHADSHAAPRWMAFYGAMISIIVKEILFRWTKSVGNRERSSALIANAWHHRSDALSSLPVAIAVAAGIINTKLAFLDHIAAFAVSLFIIYAAWNILKKAVLDIIDTGVPEQHRNEIRGIVTAIEEVKDVHAIRTRSMGSGLFIDLHVLVDPDMTVKEGHDISGIVKKVLKEKNPHIMDVIVHIEPH